MCFAMQSGDNEMKRSAVVSHKYDILLSPVNQSLAGLGALGKQAAK